MDIRWVQGVDKGAGLIQQRIETSARSQHRQSRFSNEFDKSLKLWFRDRLPAWLYDLTRDGGRARVLHTDNLMEHVPNAALSGRQFVYLVDAVATELLEHWAGWLEDVSSMGVDIEVCTVHCRVGVY